MIILREKQHKRSCPGEKEQFLLFASKGKLYP